MREKWTKNEDKNDKRRYGRDNMTMTPSNLLEVNLNFTDNIMPFYGGRWIEFEPKHGA